MNHTCLPKGHRAPTQDHATAPAEAFAPDDLEPLDDETLAAILAVDRNADPILSAMIRAALALAREEERQEMEECASTPIDASFSKEPDPPRDDR